MFGLFGSHGPRIAALIDVGSSSVGGALGVFPSKGGPMIPYATREPIEELPGGRTDVAMLRALETVMQRLHEEGRVAVSRTTTPRTIERVFISLDAPWQTTTIETKSIAEGKTFTFTHDLVGTVLKEHGTLPEGKRELRKEVIATLLNGYQTEAPYGKRVERADIVLLSSYMEADTMNIIGRSVRRFGAKRAALLMPIQSLSHAVLRAQYPHDKDFLLMLVGGEATDVLFAKQGIIMDATSIAAGLRDIQDDGRLALRTLPVNADTHTVEEPSPPQGRETAWSTSVRAVLKDFATRRALPRIIFLVADDGSAGALKNLLDTPDMHSLWLSDEPLTFIPVVSKLLSSFIRHQGEADSDVMLDLVTLYAELSFRKGA